MFVEESGMHTSMDRLRSRAPKGLRAYGKVPRNRGKNTTLIASMSLSGMGEAMCIQGATDAKAFKLYIEHFLAPTLKEGQVVVLDKLGAHRIRRVTELIEGSRAFVPALLLSRSKSDRRSVLQDKEHPKKAWSAYPRSSPRSAGGGTHYGQCC